MIFRPPAARPAPPPAGGAGGARLGRQLPDRRAAADLLRPRQGRLHGDVGQHPDGQLRGLLRRRAHAPHPARPGRGDRRPAPPGFRRIVLLGFSMGATVVTHYQALRQPAEVVGVVHAGPPGLAAGRAAAAVGPLRGRAGLRGGHRAGPHPPRPRLRGRPPRPHLHRAPRPGLRRAAPRRRGLDLPHLVVLARARAPHAESRLRIGHVTVPLAIVQAGEDELVRDAEGFELETIARQGDCPERPPHHDPGRRPRLQRLRRRPHRRRCGWLDGRLSRT